MSAGTFFKSNFIKRPDGQDILDEVFSPFNRLYLFTFY